MRSSDSVPPPARVFDSPLAETYQQLAARASHLQVEIGAPDAIEGWISAADLLHPDSPHPERLAGLRMAAFPRYRMSHAASNLHDAARRPPLLAAIAALWIDARVPDVRPDNLLYRFNESGEIEAWRLLRGHFVGLPGDRAAAHSAFSPATDRDMLRREMMAQLNQHLGLLNSAVRRLHPFPERTLWAYASDTIAGLAAIALRMFGRAGAPFDVLAEAEQLMDLLPARGTSRCLRIDHCGQTEYLPLLVNCCYWYLQDGEGRGDGQKCGGCPLRPVEERVAGYKAWMETRKPPGHGEEHGQA